MSNDNRHDAVVPLIKEISSGTLKTEFGDFRLHYFTDGKNDAVALTSGNVKGMENVICRIHSECLFTAAFFSIECDCKQQIMESMQCIHENNGVLIYLFQNGRGNGLPAMIAALDLRRNGQLSQAEAYEHIGFPDDQRNYDIAAKIILHFGIESVRLISRNTDKIKCLNKFKIKVSRHLDSTFVFLYGNSIMETVDYEKRNIELFEVEKKSIIVISDLNIDHIVTYHGYGEEEKTTKVGGCAYHSARSFKEGGLDPIIIGSIGNDDNGDEIVRCLREEKLKATIQRNTGSTGVCRLDYNNITRTNMSYDEKNANNYDFIPLFEKMNLTPYRVCFITAHMFFRTEREKSKRIIELMCREDISIVLDFVPHDIYNRISFEDVCKVINNQTKPIFMLICETKTAAGFLKGSNIHDDDDADDKRLSKILELFIRLDIKYLVLRYGRENVEKQNVYLKDTHTNKFIAKEIVDDTGFNMLKPEEVPGFGERLTAKLINKYFFKDYESWKPDKQI